MAIFKRNPQPTTLGDAISNEIKTEITNTIGARNVIDLIGTLSDKRSQKAALRSLAGSVQFTMISTADWIVRREDAAIASEDPTLDERNELDEFTRGSDHDDEIAREFGFETQQNPTEKLKTYSHLYYGLVDAIRSLRPEPFERPKGLKDVLREYGPRNAVLNEDTMKLLESVESEPGEFQAARDAARERKGQQLDQRRPRILQLLEQNADCMPMTEVFTELPVPVQLKLATTAWKGIWFSRKSLVAYIASSGKTEDIGAVRTMEADMQLLEQWCRDFEHKHSEIIDALVDTGMKVYGIDDAKDDVKKPRQR